MSQIDTSDETLVHLVAARNVAALEALYDRHARTVYSLSLRIVREPSLADEVLQDTFWQVWQKAAAFEGTGAAAAWLHRIARNKSLDQLRRHQRQPHLHTAALTEDEQQVFMTLPMPGASVEQQVERDWQHQQVRYALRALPQEQRQCVELAYFAGMNQHEIAAYMATPVGTVKTRVRLGLEKLARSLRIAGVDGGESES